MQSFSRILDLCQSFSDTLPGVVFIGGVAVYLHSCEAAVATIVPESSHDADFMISFSGYGGLKDMEEITYNSRLHKHQMIVDEVEFDIYVERLNGLIVPYDDVYAQSDTIGTVQVACLEHLLVLKLEAFKSRKHTSKGEKDRRDIAKIGLLLGRKSRIDLIEPYMREELAEHLREVAKSSVFHDLCERNVHEAKRMREGFAGFVDDVLR
jgi:hypothetical protein